MLNVIKCQVSYQGHVYMQYRGSRFYSTINFGSNHSGSSLHLNITNDVSSASLDKDRVSSFTCLFDGLISSDFRIVIILILLDSGVYNLCSLLPHMLILTIFVYL